MSVLHWPSRRRAGAWISANSREKRVSSQRSTLKLPEIAIRAFRLYHMKLCCRERSCRFIRFIRESVMQRTRETGHSEPNILRTLGNTSSILRSLQRSRWNALICQDERIKKLYFLSLHARRTHSLLTTRFVNRLRLTVFEDPQVRCWFLSFDISYRYDISYVRNLYWRETK